MGDATSHHAAKIDGQLDSLLSAAIVYREARNGLRDTIAECLAAVGVGKVRNQNITEADAIVILGVVEMRDIRPPHYTAVIEMRDTRPLRYASVLVSAVALREAQRRLEDAAWEYGQ